VKFKKLMLNALFSALLFGASLSGDNTWVRVNYNGIEQRIVEDNMYYSQGGQAEVTISPKNSFPTLYGKVDVGGNAARGNINFGKWIGLPVSMEDRKDVDVLGLDFKIEPFEALLANYVEVENFLFTGSLGFSHYHFDIEGERLVSKNGGLLEVVSWFNVLNGIYIQPMGFLEMGGKVSDERISFYLNGGVGLTAEAVFFTSKAEEYRWNPAGTYYRNFGGIRLDSKVWINEDASFGFSTDAQVTLNVPFKSYDDYISSLGIGPNISYEHNKNGENHFGAGVRLYLSVPKKLD